MTLTLDSMHTFQHTADFAMTCPTLDPDDHPTIAASPIDELAQLCDAQKARLLAIAPAVLEIMAAEAVLDARYSALATHLAVITRGAASAGFGTIPCDPQGYLFGGLMDAVGTDVTHLLVAIGLDRCDPDRLANLTQNGATP
jgi:hypothetical protein